MSGGPRDDLRQSPYGLLLLLTVVIACVGTIWRWEREMCFEPQYERDFRETVPFAAPPIDPESDIQSLHRFVLPGIAKMKSDNVRLAEVCRKIEAENLQLRAEVTHRLGEARLTTDLRKARAAEQGALGTPQPQGPGPSPVAPPTRSPAPATGPR